jgi:hypothetical protein
MHHLYIRKYVLQVWLIQVQIIKAFQITFTAQIFDNFTSFKWLSNRSFNNTFWNITCLVTLLALWRDLLSNTGEFELKLKLRALKMLNIVIHNRHCYVVHWHNRALSFWSAWLWIGIRALCIRKNIINIQVKR